MTVNFFEIRNCSFETYMGEPVLFAPSDTDETVLMTRGFRRNEEGRWFRPVNMAEYNFIAAYAYCGEATIDENNTGYINNYAPPVPYMQQNYGQQVGYADNTPNILCYVSVGLCAVGFPMSFIGTILVGGLFFIAALILMIIVRVKYPHNTFGKVLCIVYIVLGAVALILTIAAAIIIAIACNQFLNDCNSCCSNIPG